MSSIVRAAQKKRKMFFTTAVLVLMLRDFSLMFSATGGQDSNGNLLDMVGPTFSNSCLVSHINFNLS